MFAPPSYAVEYMDLPKYFVGATIPHIYFKDYQREGLTCPPLKSSVKLPQHWTRLAT